MNASFMQIFRRFALFAATATFVTAAAAAQSDTASLQTRLLGKTYFLRSLCAGDNLRFSADGNPTQPCEREPFSVGLLSIDKVEAVHSDLRLTAHRVGIAFRNNAPMEIDLSKPYKGRKPHAVTLWIAAPPSGDYTIPLRVVLTSSYRDLLPNVPEPFQPFFRSYLVDRTIPEDNASQSSTATPQAEKPLTQEQIDAAQTNPAAGLAIYSGSKENGAEPKDLMDAAAIGISQAGKNGVSVPKVIHQHEANYSPEAKSMLYSGRSIIGVVVDEHGNIARKWVRKPAGLGLDEEAVVAIDRYKFEPAQKNGKPVSAIVNIQVSFQIF